MSNIAQSLLKNHILSRISPSDFAMLAPNLSLVDLPRGTELNVPGQHLEYCWFMESGIASIVATSFEGHETEVGIVGHDGMLNVATVLGVDSSPLRSFIQISGSGFRIPSRALKLASHSGQTLQDELQRYTYAHLIQIAHTALANASFSVEERLARWLLMCADRVGNKEIKLTHEFLSVMLNVRRAGVTMAIQSLERAGFVRAHRGALTIINRASLEAFARDAYVPLG